jgi:hypothetical protein
MAKAAFVPAVAVPIRAVLALALLACVALPAAASAQGTGGTQPQASPTPTPAPKSAPALPPARSKITLTRLACATGCGADGAVRPGALLRVRGTGLRRTAEVHFDGAAGTADDVAAAPVKRRKTSVDVRVPLGAATGALTVLDKDGVLTKPAPAPLTVEVPPAATNAVDGPSIDVDVQAPKAFFDSARPMKMSYVVHDDRAVNVRVELVRVKDQAVIASWTPGSSSPRCRRSCSGTAWRAGRCRSRAATCSASAPPMKRARCAPPARRRRRPPRPPSRIRPRSGSCATRSRSSARTATARPSPASAAAAATRAKTSSPPAARRWWRRAAAS